MKSIIAFSDSHGAVIPQRVTDVLDESDFIFFTGDGLADIEYRLSYLKDKLYAVRGNCDGVRAEDELVVEVERAKFLLVHGHRFHDPLDLVYRAKELGCDAVLFGHMHAFSDETYDGVRLINLGSLSSSRYGDLGYVYIAVNGKNIFANFVKIL